MSEVTIEKEAWENVKMDIVNLKNRVTNNETGIKDFEKYKEKNGDRKHSWLLSILPVVAAVSISLIGGVTFLEANTKSLRLEIKSDMKEMKDDIKDFIKTAIKK